MNYDLPPKLWLPAKPAIIRAASLDDAKLAMPLLSTFAAASVRGLRGSSAESPALLNLTGKTYFGNMTVNGGNSAAFDGTTSQAESACARRSGATTAYVGCTIGAPTRFFSAVIYGSNDYGFGVNDNASTTLYVYGKNGVAPASETDGTSLGSVAFTDTSNESSGRSITSSDTATAYDHLFCRIVGSGGAGAVLIAEVSITGL